MRRQLLYITSVQPQRDKPALTEATRSVITTLRRDFEVSLAVVGPASTADLNSRRADWRGALDLLAYHEVSHAMRRYLFRIIP